jgi:hypothetical protein
MLDRLVFQLPFLDPINNRNISSLRYSSQADESDIFA